MTTRHPPTYEEGLRCGRIETLRAALVHHRQMVKALEAQLDNERNAEKALRELLDEAHAKTPEVWLGKRVGSVIRGLLDGWGDR